MIFFGGNSVAEALPAAPRRRAVRVVTSKTRIFEEINLKTLLFYAAGLINCVPFSSSFRRNRFPHWHITFH